MAHDFVSFSDALFSSFIDSDKVGGPSGIAEFAADIHSDVKEAKVEVRARWLEFLHKMGIEHDARQDVDQEGLFSPEEAEQRMIAAVLEQIQFNPDVAEKFLSTAVRFIASLPDRDARLSHVEQVIADARKPDWVTSLEHVEPRTEATDG